MDSENTPAPALPRRSRLRTILLVLAGILLILAAALGWLLASASGASAAFSLIESLSGGTLSAQGVEGRIIGPLRVERLTVDTPATRLTLSGLQLDWRPQALLENTLHVTRLHVAHLASTAKADQPKEQAKLPDSIALPMKVQADDIQLVSGEINRGPDMLATIGPVALGIDFDGSRYQLQLRRLVLGSPVDKGNASARISGQTTLSSIKPYALSGSFASEGNASIDGRTIGANGKLNLGGSLAELATDLHLVVNQARIDGKAMLRPFTDQPLGKADVSARALDLSRLDTGLPHTALDADLTVAENGAGTLRIRNAEAGTYDEKKIPVATFDLAFRQEATQWHFDRIAALLGTAAKPAGKLGGAGRYAGGALTLNLRTDALDLKRIDRRARATQIEGTLDLRHAAGKQEFAVALSEPFNGQQLALEARGSLADNKLALDRFDLRAGSGHVDASGHVSLAGTQSFDATARISRFRLQELGRFPQIPALELNGNLSLRGVRQPQLEADLSFRITDSRLAGQPLLGEGEAQLRGERLQVPRFILGSGANRLNIEGQLSDSNTELVFALDAPQLRQLGPAFDGALEAKGTVRGNLMQPRVDAQWRAVNARLPGSLQIDSMQGKADVAIDRKQPLVISGVVADVNATGMRLGENRLANLNAQARFAPAGNAPLALTLRAAGIATPGLAAEQLTFNANGTTAQHAIDVAIKETGQSWQLKARGGLHSIESEPTWKGNIDAFDANGRFNARLAGPATLLASAAETRLGRFLLDTDTGRIAVEQFNRDADGIATRGRVEQVQLARVLERAAPAAQIRTDLRIDGEWNIRIGDTLSGEVSLRRERGDVTVLGNTPLALGLQNLSATATAQDGRLALQMLAEGRQLGRIDVVANTAMGNGSNRLAIAPDAPVAANVHIDVPSLAWAGPMASPALAVDGKLQSAVTVAGTFGQPRLSGRITGEALKLSMTGLGLDLRNGVLDSEFQGDQLMIRNLRFQGAEGQVALSGPIDIGDASIAAQLALRAERFALLNRADRRIVISGDTRLDWKDKAGKLSGALTVDSGHIDLGQADKPQLSDDVVIVGREKKSAAKTALAIDLALSLGDGVTVVGRGLNATLGGEIRIASEAGETLQANGTFQVIKGTFSAYGRDLAIEQGGLRFRGNIANPSLDILAMRRGQEVEAGVSVRGNVLAPRITLVSEPTVPDAEKLSWLVLGRGLATAGETDVSALQAAAGALLSEGAKASVQSRIAGAFGLDTFNVGTSQDTLQQRIVTLGKQISSKLYVSYQQGLESAASVVLLRYVLSPKLSIEAEAGTRSAISLFYNLAFD